MSYRFTYGATPNELSEQLIVSDDDYVIVSTETAPTELKRAKKSAISQTLPSNLVDYDYIKSNYDNVVLADNPFFYLPFHNGGRTNFRTSGYLSSLNYTYFGTATVAQNPFKYTDSVVNGFGNAISFSNNGNQVVALAKEAHIGFNIYQNRTIEFWLRYASTPNGPQQFIADQQQFGNSTTFINNTQFSINSNVSYYNTTGNKIGWFSNHTTSNNEYRFVSNIALVSGTTYHIVFTLDTTTIRLYVNGVLDKTQTHDQKSKPTGNIALGRGAGTNSFPDTPNGLFSAFAFYDYPLTAAQVLAHYNAGKF